MTSLIRLLSVAFSLLHCLAKLGRFAGAANTVRAASWRAKLKSVGENVVFYKGIIIHSPDKVSVGRGTRIAEYVHMWGGGGIEIGEDVLIASHSVITSVTHDTHAPVYAKSSIKKPVRIEDNVWIGSNCVILPGVTIGKNAIVGAGAVIIRDVAAGDIVGGVPAKSLKRP